LLDVIVVGAGPAGNIAAHKLSELGYRVAVLDWRRSLGDKLCTGIVGRECVERFPPQDEHIFGEVRSATIVAPSGKGHTIVQGEAQAYIIDRVAYVASLASRASDAGANYRLGEKVTEVQRTAAGAVVETSSAAGPRRYEAEVVIIASGFGSPLLRKVGLSEPPHTDYMLGCQSEVVADGLENTEVYLGDEIAPGSFCWLVPLDDSKALAGLVSRRKLNGHMYGFLSGLQELGKVSSVINEPRQWGIPIRPLPRTYGDRVVVVGDAAGHVKPTTGGGIYYAQLSGGIAATAVHDAFTANDFSDRQLKKYEAGWKAVFGRELRIGYYARRLYETLGDEQIERLLDQLLSDDIRNEFMESSELLFDWHGGLVLKAIGHHELGRLIRSFGPAVAPFLARLTRLMTSIGRPADDTESIPSPEPTRDESQDSQSHSRSIRVSKAILTKSAFSA
jgi:geranylgeranyl reductase family protein